MKRSITFTLNGLPKSLNGAHGHWRTAAKHRKAWREKSAWVCKSTMNDHGSFFIDPMKAVRVTCTRFSTKEMDFDNLVASFKPIIDGLVDARLIADDSSKIIIDRRYLCGYAPEGRGYVEITVGEL